MVELSKSILMQFQSDVLQLQVELAKLNESTALGAAYLAGLATSFWPNQEALSTLWVNGQTYQPHMDEVQATALYTGWQKAVEATRILNHSYWGERYVFI